MESDFDDTSKAGVGKGQVLLGHCATAVHKRGVRQLVPRDSPLVILFLGH